ncbi:hypothetical protein TRAPUB_6189, partial [Trametes pubescens]
ELDGTRESANRAVTVPLGIYGRIVGERERSVEEVEFVVRNDDEHALVRQAFLRLSTNPRMAAAPTQLADDLALRLSDLQDPTPEEWPARPPSPPLSRPYAPASRSAPRRPGFDDNWGMQAPREDMVTSAAYLGQHGGYECDGRMRPTSGPMNNRYQADTRPLSEWRPTGWTGRSLGMTRRMPYMTSVAGPSERSRWTSDVRVGRMGGRRSMEAPVWSETDWYHG